MRFPVKTTPVTTALPETRRFLLLALCLFCASLNAQEKNISIPIRAFGALTGPVKSFGINSRAALRAASSRIDDAGGIRLADGSIGHFSIDYSDDHCNADDGRKLLNQASLSNALAVIGPSCSSVAEPLYSDLQHHAGDENDHGLKIPVFTDGATKADLARISDWAFRNSPNERDMYPVLWKWVHTHHPELKTVFAGEEADFAHSHSTLQNIIIKSASENGFVVTGRTKWSIEDSVFAESAAAIKASNADVVIVSAHALTTCGVLKELAKLHYRPKLLVGLTSASTPETLQLCGAEAEGLLIPTSFIADSPERKAEQTSVEASGGIADLHSMAAWEILYALKAAIESSGIVPGKDSIASERDQLRIALSQQRTMNGVMGTIARTADRESLKPFVLVQARNGIWNVVSDTSRPVILASNVEEDIRIPFGDSGLKLFLRHMVASASGSGKRNPVLFVHGATFPSGLAAAFRFGDRSWMQDLAEHGFDVWALDFMGYGESDRYPLMTKQGSPGHTPLLQAPEAADQIATAASFIRIRTNSAKVSIIAHSWGTLAAGIYAANHGDKLDRLVLFGPFAPRNSARLDQSTWQETSEVTVADQMKRFRGYLPNGEAAVLDEEDMGRWGEMYLASDPSSGHREPHSVRVPFGPEADIELVWSGTFPYDPKTITVPVLIVRGEWDTVARNEDAEWIFSRLVNSPVRRDIRIGRATHVMHLEEGRFQLYQETRIFLEGER
jgi:branched-chain amino acid transport system substrate-binding protein